MFVGAACIVFTTTAAILRATHGQMEDIPALFPAIMKRERAAMQEPCDDKSEEEWFDFIIVGAGTAGSVLANRLSEVSDWEILLLEAGGEGTEIMNVPFLWAMFQNTDVEWNYGTVASETAFQGMNRGRIAYPSGRGVGGSTLLNYMLHSRGNRRDYDNWEEMGNPGWGYDDVLPYFKKMEDMQIPELKDNAYHSVGGNVKVNYPPYKTEMSDIFLEAGRELGESIVDYNGEHQTGFARVQTTTANGSRWSATKGYLYPIRDRPNFHLKKTASVKKILINEAINTAYGVIYSKDGKNYTVKARKEVIISAGAIASPQLLMISGVGPKAHLEELGIRVIKDLKVGYNLMDHIGFLALYFTLNESKAVAPMKVLSNPNNLYEYYVNNAGPLTSTAGVEVFYRHELESSPSHIPGWPDVELAFFSHAMTTHPQYAAAYGINMDLFTEYISPIKDTPTYQVFSFQMRPKSRGRVTLSDTDAVTPPLIDLNVLSEEEDILTQVAGIRKAIEITKAPALQKIGAKWYDRPVPVCKDFEPGSDDYWRCALVNMSTTTYHPCGTCKMGPETDEDAVVDSTLKVYGIKNLRVVDASVFPQIISGHLQAPTYMVAEKAAELIRSDYSNNFNKDD